MQKLENRVALITGAGRGIGRAIALAYATAGARLALAARTRSELEQTAWEAQALGAATGIVTVDVSDQHQVEAMVQATLDHLAHATGLVPTAPDVARHVREQQVLLHRMPQRAFGEIEPRPDASNRRVAVTRGDGGGD